MPRTTAPKVAEFARELKGLLDLRGLARAVEAGSDVAAANPRMIGDLQCAGYEVKFDEGLVQDPASGMSVSAALRLSLKQIVGTFHVHPETGLVVQLTVEIERGLPSNVVSQGGGMGMSMDQMVFRTKYAFDLTKGAAEGRPSIPADLLRRLSR